MTEMWMDSNEDFLTMVWLLKWASPAVAFIAAIAVLTTEFEADTNAGRIMGHYFQIVFAFAVISVGMGGFYHLRITERLLSNYPDEFPRSKWSYFPWEALQQGQRMRQAYKLLLEVDDAKIQRWRKMVKFWSYCICFAMVMVVPVGMIIFFILLSTMK